jgi:hypothetical protein
MDRGMVCTGQLALIHPLTGETIMAKKNLLSKYLGKEEEAPSTTEPKAEEPINEDPIAEESPASPDQPETDTPPQVDPIEDTQKEEAPVTEEPKRGRKKGTRRDRVIVMLDRETIEVLDSFAISRSGIARAVVLGCQEFLVNIEGEVSEEELVTKIKDRLG